MMGPRDVRTVSGFMLARVGHVRMIFLTIDP